MSKSVAYLEVRAWARTAPTWWLRAQLLPGDGELTATGRQAVEDELRYRSSAVPFT